MTYHLILCLRECGRNDANLDTVFREALSERQLSEDEASGVTLLYHNAILVHPNHIHCLGALILATLQKRKFPYVVFQVRDEAWEAHGKLSESTEDILKKS